ncbi:MAG: hypothetical protein ACI8PZ_000536 [Myxococcota bacterium]|jgi:hypothetical protein
MDLKSQLAAAYGRKPPPEDAPAPAAPASALDDGAHLRDPWIELLRELVRSVPGSPALAKAPKLGQARQVTDQLVRSLKASGRKRVAKELGSARDAFMARRDKAAWGQIKARLTEAGTSAKAYRALKQSGDDPVALLGRLRRIPDDTLSGMGAARLRGALTSG